MCEDIGVGTYLDLSKDYAILKDFWLLTFSENMLRQKYKNEYTETYWKNKSCFEILRLYLPHMKYITEKDKKLILSMNIYDLSRKIGYNIPETETIIQFLKTT